MIYLGLKVFYHRYFTGIIIEMMITEIEETVMKGERNETRGAIEVSSYHSYTDEKRTDLFCVFSRREKNVENIKPCFCSEFSYMVIEQKT